MIIWQQRRTTQLDGLPSTDISYYGDRLGHGLNQTSSIIRQSRTAAGRSRMGGLVGGEQTVQ